MKNDTREKRCLHVVPAISLIAGCMTLLGTPAYGQTAAETGNAASTGAAVRGSDISKAQPRQTIPAHRSARAPQNRDSASGRLNCMGETSSPGRLALPLGKSTLIRLPEPIINRTIGNPGIVQAMLVSRETLYLLGKDVGTTNMILQGRSGACTVVDVVVGMDSAGLEETFKSLLPPEEAAKIRVTAAADTLVLSGTLSDAMAVSRAVEIANAFVRRPANAVAAGQLQPIPQDNEKAAGLSGAASGTGAPDGNSSGGRNSSSAARVINLLMVDSPQQVMLEVKVAEVSKTLLDKLGFSSVLQGSSGSWAYTLLSNFLTGTANGIFDATKSNGNSVTLEAEKRDGLIKILAEPTLMAVSGQEGKFLAGGTIFIPVSQEDERIGLEEKDFGVKLTFRPTVLSGNRINLQVRPEVSELSREGIGISAVGVPGRAILPLITKREASTTVQLMDGQSFAIGGLIKNNSAANIKALPILGEIPVLGALFRSTDFQEDKTELLFVVTPRLVKPLPANYVLPTDKVTPAGRAELFLGGRLESTPDQQPPSQSEPSAGQDVSQPGSTGGFELK
ncbi:type II and III secretion system protein family protein [Oxalobacteraceae bacterium R-40]|uniref:Type II and III secretion system protein family protein n=1 Tax=Keguizhuia sedimenti TaxID=3064264 RepID=A0ABU1BJ59_9BURK|nr:type II and III secretion system protein family protein [Oxalobacteraceae bacterium R-40]